jgi:hypothetical protein
VESRPKALKQGELRSIARRPTGRIGAQAHNRARGRDKLDRCLPELAALEPMNVGVRYPECRADGAQAQAARHASVPEIHHDARERLACPAPSPVRRSLSRSHVGRTIAASPYPGITWQTAG